MNEDMAQRVADLGAERDELTRIVSAYSPAKEMTQALKQAKASGDAARKECDELRARLAELERQKPVRLSDEKIEQARNDAVIGAPEGVLMGRIAGLWQAELYELARAIETAVLAANGMTE